MVKSLLETLRIKEGLFCFLPIVVFCFFNDSIPEKIINHIGFYQIGYLNKWEFVLLITSSGFVLHLVYMLLLNKKPDWIGVKKKGRYKPYYFPILINVVTYILIIVSK